MKFSTIYSPSQTAIGRLGGVIAHIAPPPLAMLLVTDTPVAKSLDFDLNLSLTKVDPSPDFDLILTCFCFDLLFLTRHTYFCI